MSVGCDDAGSGRRQWRQQSSGDGGQERVTAEEMKEHGRQEETMAVLSLWQTEATHEEILISTTFSMTCHNSIITLNIKINK